MGLPEDHPAVARGCSGVMASMLLVFVADLYRVKRLFPNPPMTSNETKALSRHLVQFALGGLSAVARCVHSGHGH
jgi:TetR/AcrR family transcriptional regulator, regulator of cefoperazone and chloramphenicol sensitivity